MLTHPAQQVLPHGIHLAPLGHAQRVVQLNRHHGYALLQTAVIAQGAGNTPSWLSCNMPSLEGGVCGPSKSNTP